VPGGRCRAAGAGRPVPRRKHSWRVTPRRPPVRWLPAVLLVPGPYPRGGQFPRECAVVERYGRFSPLAGPLPWLLRFPGALPRVGVAGGSSWAVAAGCCSILSSLVRRQRCIHEDCGLGRAVLSAADPPSSSPTSDSAPGQRNSQDSGRRPGRGRARLGRRLRATVGVGPVSGRSGVRGLPAVGTIGREQAPLVDQRPEDVQPVELAGATNCSARPISRAGRPCMLPGCNISV
jgi:hypothetical protein